MSGQNTSISTISAIASNIGHVWLKAGAAAVVEGLADYYLMEKRDIVEVFGFELPNWGCDMILVGLSSAVGDTVSITVLPWTEKTFGASATVQNIINMTTPPLICGTTALVAKSFLVSPATNDKLKEFLVATGSKLVGDRLVGMYVGDAPSLWAY